jgi:hypothetical protein
MMPSRFLSSENCNMSEDLVLIVSDRKKNLQIKKANGRERGSVRAHSYSWSLSSPQQPLETEDSPTVSLAPKYTSQCSCRARRSLSQLLAVCFP